MRKSERQTCDPSIGAGETNCNPTDIGYWALISEDFKTHNKEWFSQGFWALFWHRFGNWRMGVKPAPLRAPLTFIYRIMYKATEILCGVMLPYAVPVGRRLKIEHFGGIIISARCFGNDVTIRQNTTFGVSSADNIEALPVIGDRVDIGAGACVLGDVIVGDDAVIGANSVVNRDVPPGAIVGGVPAKLIRIRDGFQGP